MPRYCVWPTKTFFCPRLCLLVLLSCLFDAKNAAYIRGGLFISWTASVSQILLLQRVLLSKAAFDCWAHLRRIITVWSFTIRVTSFSFVPLVVLIKALVGTSGVERANLSLSLESLSITLGSFVAEASGQPPLFSSHLWAFSVNYLRALL